jgi:hypothetical protein
MYFVFKKIFTKTMEAPRSAELSEDVKTAIQRGLLRELVNSPLWVQHIDFGKRVDNAYFDRDYRIELRDDTVATHPVVCIFPQERNGAFFLSNAANEAVVERNLVRFNRALNRRLENSAQAEGTRLAIAYGGHVYLCDNLTGTLYMTWAKLVNVGTHQHRQIMHVGAPVLINMNGHHGYKHIIILNPTVSNPFLDIVHPPLGQILLHRKWEQPLFVAETPSTVKQEVQTLSAAEVTNSLNVIGRDPDLLAGAILGPNLEGEEQPQRALMQPTLCVRDSRDPFAELSDDE